MKIDNNLLYFAVFLGALVFGLTCVALSYVASHLGGILQAALSLFGILGAPMMGIFTLGMIFPWANKWGAYSGLLTSLCLMLWIGVGNYVNKPPVPRAPIATHGCNWNLTLDHDFLSHNFSYHHLSNMMEKNTSLGVNNDQESSLPIYSISYLWYSPLAVLVVSLVGLPVSFLTGYTRPSEIDPRLISPVFDIFCPYLPKSWRKVLRFGVDHDKKHLQIGKGSDDVTEFEIYGENVLEDGSSHLTARSNIVQFEMPKPD